MYECRIVMLDLPLRCGGGEDAMGSKSSESMSTVVNIEAKMDRLKKGSPISTQWLVP